MKYYKASKDLSSGQVVTVFWQQDEWAKSAMEISMVVGKSISDNKKWYNDHVNFRAVKSTGDCGLEALKFAVEVILQLQKVYPILTIEWLDDKRARAYKYLERFGFVFGHYTNHPESKVYFYTKGNGK